MNGSRYSGCATLSLYDAAGHRIDYLANRILPQPAPSAAASPAQVAANEINRLDLVAYRTLQNAELAWRIADANAAMDPFELCSQAGIVLALPGSTL